MRVCLCVCLITVVGAVFVYLVVRVLVWLHISHCVWSLIHVFVCGFVRLVSLACVNLCVFAFYWCVCLVLRVFACLCGY